MILFGASPADVGGFIVGEYARSPRSHESSRCRWPQVFRIKIYAVLAAEEAPNVFISETA